MTTDRHQKKPYPLRMPDKLREDLELSASAGNRSLHAEIVARLQQSFNLEPMKETKRDELVKLINDAIDERLARDKEKKAGL